MGTKNTLVSLFGKSPLRLIQEYMKVAASVSSRLPIFLEACFAGDWESAKPTPPETYIAQPSRQNIFHDR